MSEKRKKLTEYSKNYLISVFSDDIARLSFLRDSPLDLDDEESFELLLDLLRNHSNSFGELTLECIFYRLRKLERRKALIWCILLDPDFIAKFHYPSKYFMNDLKFDYLTNLINKYELLEKKLMEIKKGVNMILKGKDLISPKSLIVSLFVSALLNTFIYYSPSLNHYLNVTGDNLWIDLTKEELEEDKKDFYEDYTMVFGENILADWLNSGRKDLVLFYFKGRKKLKKILLEKGLRVRKFSFTTEDIEKWAELRS